MGRHTLDEQVQLAIADLDALSMILADKPYLLGAQLCWADASVYSFVWGALCPLFALPIRLHAETKANLVAYQYRLQQQFFPELT